jgi:2-hydroxy-3-oxopropionate reductase
MANLGFVGLGIMGKSMAGRLIAAGHDLFLHSRSGVPRELMEKGGRPCANAREVAQKAEVVFVMVPDTIDVEKVLFGANGVSEGLTQGKIVVDMSSISPIETKAFAKLINAKGCDYLDAPVSGVEIGEKSGTLTIMVGGKEEVFHRVMPFFQLMGKNITLIGTNGDGQACKVANQIIVALNLEAVAEGLLFAVKAGADPAKVRQALLGGFASSRVLEVHGERMIQRNFQPGFRVELHQKDLNLALNGARAVGLSLPNTATVQQLFSSCVAHGGAGWDHSSLVTVLEALAGIQISKEKS